ncbi:MAG: WbqC family protein [Patescibacteria group bacterium]
MTNKIAILQPSYIPWLGYFDQINRVDTFIFYDDVLYTKNDWRNRNKIKTPSGVSWLTIPVTIKNRLKDYLLIKDVMIIDPNILKNHLKTIEFNYKKSPFFQDFYSTIAPIFNTEYHLLADLSIDIIKTVCEYIGLKGKNLLRSSDLGIVGTNPTDRLINLCKKFEATNYLSSDNSKNYLKEKMFEENDIILEYQKYSHPRYKQSWGDFVPYLSIIDLIFNEGPKSLSILSNNV